MSKKVHPISKDSLLKIRQGLLFVIIAIVLTILFSILTGIFTGLAPKDDPTKYAKIINVLKYCTVGTTAISIFGFILAGSSKENNFYTAALFYGIIVIWNLVFAILQSCNVKNIEWNTTVEGFLDLLAMLYVVEGMVYVSKCLGFKNKWNYTTLLIVTVITLISSGLKIWSIVDKDFMSKHENVAAAIVIVLFIFVLLEGIFYFVSLLMTRHRIKKYLTKK